MTVTQIEALLKEASLEYLRSRSNRAEVEYYAKLLIETTTKENN